MSILYTEEENLWWSQPWWCPEWSWEIRTTDLRSHPSGSRSCMRTSVSRSGGCMCCLGVSTMTTFPPLRAGLQVKVKVPWNLGRSFMLLDSGVIWWSTEIKDTDIWSLLGNCLYNPSQWVLDALILRFGCYLKKMYINKSKAVGAANKGVPLQ